MRHWPAASAGRYELRLHSARGYGALKGILGILAEDEPLTLTEIALRLQRTPGSTKDYLSWLEDVDLVAVAQKRYSFTDPLLRLWVRLHCRPAPPNDDEIASAVHQYALARLPTGEPAPALALAGGSPADGDDESRGELSRSTESRSAFAAADRLIDGSAQALQRQARGFLLGVLLRPPRAFRQHLVRPPGPRRGTACRGPARSPRRARTPEAGDRAPAATPGAPT